MVDFKEFIENIDKNKDGYFLIENRNGSAYLCVFPPADKKGKYVDYKDVIQRLNLFQIEYNEEQVKNIVKRADGQWYEIGKWIEPESEDAKFEIILSDDFRKAYIEIIPPVYKGKWITFEDILETLKEKGIKVGIKEDLLYKIANRELNELKEEGEWKKRFLIAEAIEPEPTIDGKIQFYCDPFPRTKPKEDESGKVDFRSLNVIQVCNQGDLIAEVIPPKKGKDGIDILGNPIPCGEGKSAVLEAGENTELKGNQIYALISGQIKVQATEDLSFAKISITEVLEIENVDFSTGNIDFPGTVRIKNKILDGFEIKAKEDIIIEKSVSNVKIFSGGDIILYGGILGRGFSYVFAEGNVYAKFIQNSQVGAKKSIYVEELILHSEIMAGEEIHIYQGRGELIGGKTICGKKLIARRIGSIAEPHTIIYAGILPEVLNELNEINLEIDKNKKLLEEVKKNQKFLETHPEKLEIEKNKNFYQKLLLAKYKLEQKIQNLNYQKELLLSSNKSHLEARIYIKEILYPNVEIFFGAKNKKYKQMKIPLNRSGYFKYDPKDRLVRFYQD
ncbi:MAG: polymerase [Leptospiraceae bacterium]|nr:MAG: polymerase [Leptospiraceae bacterium]